MAGQILLVWWHIVWPHSIRALLHPQPSRLEVFMKTPSLCSWQGCPQYQFYKLLNGQFRLLRKLGVSYITRRMSALVCLEISISDSLLLISVISQIENTFPPHPPPPSPLPSPPTQKAAGKNLHSDGQKF